MRLCAIINEIQRKYSTTNIERENLSGIFGVGSIADKFKKNRGKQTASSKMKHQSSKSSSGNK